LYPFTKNLFEERPTQDISHTTLTLKALKAFSPLFIFKCMCICIHVMHMHIWFIFIYE